MNQKIEFAMKAMITPNFRQLCREYGISAKTGYKWKERFINNGLAGLEEESRRNSMAAKRRGWGVSPVVFGMFAACWSM